MKYLKLFEDIDLTEDWEEEPDDDFNKDDILDLSGLNITELVAELEELLKNNSDYMDFSYHSFIEGDYTHKPRKLGKKIFDDVRDTIISIHQDDDDLIFQAVNLEYIDEYGDYDTVDVFYKVNRDQNIFFLNKDKELEVNISI